MTETPSDTAAIQSAIEEEADFIRTRTDAKIRELQGLLNETPSSGSLFGALEDPYDNDNDDGDDDDDNGNGADNYDYRGNKENAPGSLHAALKDLLTTLTNMTDMTLTNMTGNFDDIATDGGKPTLSTEN